MCEYIYFLLFQRSRPLYSWPGSFSCMWRFVTARCPVGRFLGVGGSSRILGAVEKWFWKGPPWTDKLKCPCLLPWQLLPLGLLLVCRLATLGDACCRRRGRASRSSCNLLPDAEAGMFGVRSRRFFSSSFLRVSLLESKESGVLRTVANVSRHWFVCQELVLEDNLQSIQGH